MLITVNFFRISHRTYCCEVTHVDINASIAHLIRETSAWCFSLNQLLLLMLFDNATLLTQMHFDSVHSNSCLILTPCHSLLLAGKNIGTASSEQPVCFLSVSFSVHSWILSWRGVLLGRISSHSNISPYCIIYICGSWVVYAETVTLILDYCAAYVLSFQLWDSAIHLT